MPTSLPGDLLPVERLFFLSDVACAGTFRCGPDDPLFNAPGPTKNHVFVFPRQSVVIEHSARAPFVAGPNVIPLYNAGQRYSRRAVDRNVGVWSDWFAVAPDVVLDVARRYIDDAEARPEAPFPVAFVPAPPDVFLQQRAIVDDLSPGMSDVLRTEERIVGLLDRILRLAATKRATRRPRRDGRDHVEQVKRNLAITLDTPISLRAIAADAGVSLFHLCRLFRRETGFTIHGYRQQLRLRRSLDEVLCSRDLLDTALRLGFDSHSHFTFAFRKAFGLTPSELRRRRTLPRN